MELGWGKKTFKLENLEENQDLAHSDYDECQKSSGLMENLRGHFETHHNG